MTKLKEVVEQAESFKSKPSSAFDIYMFHTPDSGCEADDPEIKSMRCELAELLRWVMKDRLRFSEQELEEFNKEL